MKISILTPYNPFEHAGAASNRLLSLINGMKTKGISFEIIIYNGFLNKKEREKFGKHGDINGIKYFYTLPIINYNLWFARINKYLLNGVINLLNKIIVSKKIKSNTDILWFNAESEALPIISGLKRKYSRLLFFSEISEYADIGISNSTNALQLKNSKKNNLQFENIILKDFDKLAFMTSDLLNHYKPKLKNAKIELIHLPMTVDLDRFNKIPLKNSNLKAPYILYLGVLNNKKDGIAILVEAFYRIANFYPLHTLYLVGFYHHDVPNLIKRINELGLNQRIIIMDAMPANEIPSLLTNANLLVLPRPNSKQAQGGFPTKLGEYLASGVPVCATTVGEIPDYLTDNETVFFAEPGSIDSFANAMERALSNPELAKKVGMAGRRVAEIQFNKDIQAQKLYEFLKPI
jgi:glycosyltransferase involved in cell wall biosynthesis